MRRLEALAAGAAILGILACFPPDARAARNRPLSVQEITSLASSGVPEGRLTDLIQQLGIDFAPTNDALETLRKGGVAEAVIQKIQKQIPQGKSPEFYLQAGDRLAMEGRTTEAAEYYRLGQESAAPSSGANPLAGGPAGSSANPLAGGGNPLAGNASAEDFEGADMDVAAALPGVDMSGLSPAARRRVLARLRTQPCPCGCGFSVAECRVKDPSCTVSLGLANQAVREAAASMPAGPGASFASAGSTGIFVNERELTPQQVAEIKAAYMFVAPPGHYWYDSRSGLWGLMGHEAAGFLRPGHDFGPLSPNPSNGTTGVFINGREINMAEAMYVQQMFGAVYRGHWWLDGATGNLGLEGNPTPLANVYMAMQQRQRQQPQRQSSGGNQGYSWSSKITGAYGGSDGSCSYVSIPGSGSVMTGNCN